MDLFNVHLNTQLIIGRPKLLVAIRKNEKETRKYSSSKDENFDHLYRNFKYIKWIFQSNLKYVLISQR